MTWTKSGDVYTQSGAVRAPAVSYRVIQGNVAVKLNVADPAHNVKAMIRTSPGGGSGWELGIEGANVVIQERAFGGSPTVRATAAHSLPAGAPFTMLARLTNNKYEVFLNGSSSAAVSYTTVTDLYARYRRCGFVSAVNGARVLRAEVCGVVSNRETSIDVVIVVCDGNVFLSADAVSWSLIASGMFVSTGPVDLEEFEGKAWGVDGTNFIVIDPLTRTASRVTPVAGSLPGQDGANPGTTRATMVRSYGPRIGLMGDPQDANNATFCAIRTTNHGLDWNTAANDDGAAFSFNAAFPGKIGEPIVSFVQASGGLAVIGCSSSIWRLVGDPAIGIPQLSRVNGAVGVCGKDALRLDSRGRVIACTDAGVYLIPRDGDAIPISPSVLTEGVQIPRAQLSAYRVQVQQDVARHETKFFLTPVVGSGPALHFGYDELTGGWQPGAGGFQPDDYPERVGPTASCVFLGEVLLGGRTGHVYGYDDAAATDDGDAIVCRFPTSLLLSGDLVRAVKLDSIAHLLGAASSPVAWKVYGGRTPEEALTGTARKLLLAGTAYADRPGQPAYGPVQAPYLVVDHEPATAGTRIAIEEVQASIRPTKLMSWHSPEPAAAPPAPCRTPDDLVHPTPGTPTPSYPSLSPSTAPPGDLVSNGGAFQPPMFPPAQVDYAMDMATSGGVVEF